MELFVVCIVENVELFDPIQSGFLLNKQPRLLEISLYNIYNKESRLDLQEKI